MLSELEKSQFASIATNLNFGIGADNMIVLQPCTEEQLLDINRHRCYWETIPSARKADFIFRMFEPSGKEAFSCGNGLMCIADHLHEQRRSIFSHIMTEIPLSCPKVVSIGYEQHSGMNWANLGTPTYIPVSIVKIPNAVPVNGFLQLVSDVTVTLQSSGFEHRGREKSFTLSGYLVFTGEPHLVILADKGISIGDVSNDMFVSERRDAGRLVDGRRIGDYSTWLVHNIGMYLNQSASSFFPAGINVTFFRIVDGEGTIEYRSFERGINHETLACGTGAVAASVVCRELDLCDVERFTVWPHRCRWYSPETYYLVRREQDEWYIYGRPELLYRGTLVYGQHL